MISSFIALPLVSIRIEERTRLTAATMPSKSMKLGMKLGIKGATIPPTLAHVLLMAYIVPRYAVGNVSIVIKNIMAKAALLPNLPIVTHTYPQIECYFRK